MLSSIQSGEIGSHVFQEIILLIYTGRDTNKMAPVILAAADRYRLEDLKTWYETRLTRQMLSKNCFEQLSLTTHHPAESMVM